MGGDNKQIAPGSRWGKDSQLRQTPPDIFRSKRRSSRVSIHLEDVRAIARSRALSPEVLDQHENSRDEDGGFPTIGLSVTHTTLRTLAIAVQGAMNGRRRVLLASTQLPNRFSVLDRILIRLIDGIVASPDCARALDKLGISSARIIEILNEHDFVESMQTSLIRPRSSSRHLVYVGELSPHSGCADFLACLVSWAKRNPMQRAAITWIGKGDLKGVIQAQPIPANLSQQFVPAAERREIISCFECADIFVGTKSVSHAVSIYYHCHDVWVACSRQHAECSGEGSG